MPSNWLPSGRLQSWASSAMSVLVAVNTTPSRSMRRRAIFFGYFIHSRPEASMTACT